MPCIPDADMRGVHPKYAFCSADCRYTAAEEGHHQEGEAWLQVGTSTTFSASLGALQSVASIAMACLESHGNLVQCHPLLSSFKACVSIHCLSTAARVQLLFCSEPASACDHENAECGNTHAALCHLRLRIWAFGTSLRRRMERRPSPGKSALSAEGMR